MVERSPMPTPREAWMARYVNRMVEKGVPVDDALANFHAAEDDFDYEADPVDAADDEMSYWDDDGETP